MQHFARTCDYSSMSSPPLKRAKDDGPEQAAAAVAALVDGAAAAVGDAGGSVDGLEGGPSTHVPAEACPEG